MPFPRDNEGNTRKDKAIPGRWSGALGESRSASGASGQDLVDAGDAGFESLAGGLVFPFLGAEDHLVAHEFDPRGERGAGRGQSEEGGPEGPDPGRWRRLLQPETVSAAAGFLVFGDDGGIGCQADVGGGDDIAGSAKFLTIDGFASDTNLLKILFSPEPPGFGSEKFGAAAPPPPLNARRRP